MPRKGTRKSHHPRARRGNRLSRSNRRTYGTGITSLTLKRGLGMPDRYTTTLRYVNSLVLDTAGGGSAVSYVFRGNSLYDPNYTGLGTQPNYYDQISAMYHHSMVWGSKISVRVISAENSNPNNPPGNYLCVLPSRTPTPPSTIDLAMQQPRARWRLIRDGSDKTYKIVNTTRTKQMLVAGPGGWSSDLIHNASSNPPDTWFWVIQANSADQVEEAKLQLQVEITYYCTFYERELQPQS